MVGLGSDMMRWSGRGVWGEFWGSVLGVDFLFFAFFAFFVFFNFFVENNFRLVERCYLGNKNDIDEKFEK